MRPYDLIAFDVDGTLIRGPNGWTVWEVLNERFTPSPTATDAAWGGLMLLQQEWRGDAKDVASKKPAANVEKETTEPQKQVVLFG